LRGDLQECGDFTGGCLTVRISGGYSHEMMGVVLT